MIRAFLASATLLLCLCFAQRAATAGNKPTVAILGLEVADDGSGIDPKTTQFAKELTEELRKRPKAGTGPYSLAPGSDKDLLELKMLANCDSEGKDCMASIGSDLATDHLMYGKVEKRDNGYQVSLKLLDVAGKTFERSISDIVPFAEATGANLASWGKKLYAKLTGATDQGTLVIKANVDRGTVYLDDQVKGNLSGGEARIAGLSEGKYKLSIESEGHVKYEADVEITAGEDTVHNATLEKTTGGTTGGTGGTGGGTAGTGGTGGTGNGHEITSGTISSNERPGGGYRALFWASLAVTAVATTGMTVYGLKVRGADATDKDNAITAWQDASGMQLNLTDACGDANNRLAGQNVNNRTQLQAVADACKTGQNHALYTNVLVGATAVGAVATVLFYYKGYIASKTSTESANGTSVTFVPTISPQQVSAGVRVTF